MADNSVSTSPTVSGTPAPSRMPIVRIFRVVAFAEAVTWLLLLIGMGFKYIPNPGNDEAVALPGALHGGVFVLYLVVTVLTALTLKWSRKLTIVALLAGIPPFGTVVFEMWAARTGRLAPAATVPGTASPSVRK